MVTVITGTTNKPVSSERLKAFFASHHEMDGTLYIGYPIIGTVEGAYPIDAIWVSKNKGLVVFNLIEGKTIVGYEDEQDNSYNMVEAKLKGHKELVIKRELQVKISVITFAPAVIAIPESTEYPICNTNNLLPCLDPIIWETPEYYEKVVSVLQSISMIRKGRKKREVNIPESRGAKLQKLEESIANLDNAQGRAVIETVEGVQRIRGLAGSGKTIVLALKAAYLHAQHSDWKIAVTFNTRSLKNQFRNLINSFYIEQTSSEPDWDNIQIIHAWGANSKSTGIYYNYCTATGVDCLDYLTAKNCFGRELAFSGACEKALKDADVITPVYDAILIDEAQDFPVSFFRICYELLKKPKRLVYAYDELQSLNLQSLPAPEELFGEEADGSPKVRFTIEADGTSKQDIILEKCYRNSRPTLVTAHALGFGIYREPDSSSKIGLVQMFEQKQLWEEIGYSVIDGELKEGMHVILGRTNDTSPSFLESHSPKDDLVMFKTFSSKIDQDQWVASQIIKNIREEELRPDDIIVINPDPLTTARTVTSIRKILYDNGVQSHVAGVDSSPDVFFDTENESVAFTGIYRAKGNEAAMVYVINANDCYMRNSIESLNSDNAKIRNRLFTAITRSKAWVRVVGVGSYMEQLEKEYKKVVESEFTLDFVYPTEEELKHLNVVNRDISQAEKNNITRQRRTLDDLLKDLEDGKIFPEDLGAGQIERLKKMLQLEESE